MGERCLARCSIAYARADCDRRGALHLAVGARLPARVSRAGCACRTLPGRAAHRRDRDGRSADATRDRRAPAAAGCARLRIEFRSTQSALQDHRARRRRTPPTGELSRQRSSRTLRHRLSRNAREGGQHGGVAPKAGRGGAGLSRGDGCSRQDARARSLPRRGRRRRRRDDRVRHGHRSTRRAFRGASRSSEKSRGVSPGDGPRGTRWRTGRRLAGLRPRRRGATARLDRGDAPPERRRIEHRKPTRWSPTARRPRVDARCCCATSATHSRRRAALRYVLEPIATGCHDRGTEGIVGGRAHRRALRHRASVDVLCGERTEKVLRYGHAGCARLALAPTSRA